MISLNEFSKKKALLTEDLVYFLLAIPGIIYFLFVISGQAQAHGRYPVFQTAPTYVNDGNRIQPNLISVSTVAAVLLASADEDRRQLYVQLSSYTQNTTGSFDICLGTFSGMTCTATSINPIKIISTRTAINDIDFSYFGQAAIYARGFDNGTVASGSATLRVSGFNDTGDDGDD